MSDVKIRQLKSDDYDEIIGLWERAGLPLKPLGRDSRKELSKQMKQSPAFFLGAEVRGKLVGVIIASSDGRKGYLNRIAVDPDCRGQGIAQRLTLAAEDALREKGIKVITLLIERDNIPSIRLAHKLGYVEHPDIIYFSKRESEDD
jgi:ribosomal protein S18 acetylase RimI-like enzyme